MPRYVLVTGCSTGIGAAVTERLVHAGFLVAAGVRSHADAQRLLDAGDDRVRPVLLDVTDEDSVACAMASVCDWTGGRLHGVVNNAGVVIGGPIEYLPLSQWRDQFEVNVVGAVSVTRQALPSLRAASGRVILIGSNSGRVSVAMLGPYCASKHALEAVAESLRLELRPQGLPVVLVEPGAVATPIWAKGLATAQRMRQSLPAEALDRYADLIAGVERAVQAQERVAIPPQRVADVVLAALTRRSPRPRYQVGADAVASALLDRFLPDRWRAPLIERLGGP